MDFKKAMKLMERGKHVQSLVSNTTYFIDKTNNKLFANDVEVDISYLTKEEMIGKWVEVQLIKTNEQYEQLSDEQMQNILKSAFNKFKFDEKYGRNTLK